MDEFEKQVYNNYLIVTRAVKGQPFRPRKDFSGFEEKPEYVAVKKLANLFKKHKHLNMESFFEAPFFVYGDNYYDLNFYCSYKAISTYTQYNDTFLIESPDSTISKKKIRESIIFITTFCKEKDINVKDYILYKEESKYNSFLYHLKDRKINIYILFAFNNFDKVVKSLSFDVKDLLAPALLKINYIRSKLYTSTQMKKNVNLFKKFVDNR